MKFYIITFLVMMLLLAGCNYQNGREAQDHSNHEDHESKKIYENNDDRRDRNNDDDDDDDGDAIDSKGKNTIKAPPKIEPDSKKGKHVTYSLNIQNGKTKFDGNTEVKTMGYNGDILGPTLDLKKGQKVTMNIKNNLDEKTTVHWHGLDVPGGKADGGPHAFIDPGEETKVEFTVNQEDATLWYHPHPHGKTAEQVYNGLAGFIYITDPNKKKDLPQDYGENDIPLVFQDRPIDSSGNMKSYSDAHKDNGMYANTVLVNGKKDPVLKVKNEKVRLRLLNGSNARDYQFKLDNNQSFEQIASDGGYLNKGVSKKSVDIAPAEREEIIVDFSKVQGNKVNIVNDENDIILPIEIDKSNENKKTVNTNDLNNLQSTEGELDKKPDKKITMEGMGKDVSINGKKFDHNRIDFTQKVGETEIWEIENKSEHESTNHNNMLHPFHVHGTQFRVISKNGKSPDTSLQGRKDTIALRPGEKAKIAVKFNHEGTYMLHCHILEHEDNGMMLNVRAKK